MFHVASALVQMCSQIITELANFDGYWLIPCDAMLSTNACIYRGSWSLNDFPRKSLIKPTFFSAPALENGPDTLSNAGLT